MTFTFYQNLDNEFSMCEYDKKLQGLNISGFNGSQRLKLYDFDKLKLNAAYDVIICYLRTINNINQEVSSYSLKHLVEDFLKKDTDGKIDYISNGTLILAMRAAGFKIRKIDSSPNCYFNVSKKSIENLMWLNKH